MESKSNPVENLDKKSKKNLEKRKSDEVTSESDEDCVESLEDQAIEPQKKKPKQTKDALSDNTDVNSVDAQESEDSEYEIEEIVGHKLVRGNVVKYEIKWKDYSADDNTMEKADSIHDDASELCEKYWDNLDIERPRNAPGYGKPAKKAKKLIKQVKEKNEEIKEEEVDSLSKHVPRCMVDKGYVVPKTFPSEKTDWRVEIKSIAAVQLSPVDKSVMLAYVEWKNGERTIHSMAEIHQKSPESLVDYYEARLRFV